MSYETFINWDDVMGGTPETLRALGLPERALDAIHQSAAESLRSSLLIALEAVGSPIERLLLLDLLHHRVRGGGAAGVVLPGNIRVLVREGDGAPYVALSLHDNSDQSSLTIEPQAPVGRYRSDFKITWRSVMEEFGCHIDEVVHVECDGHDFHERTKAQARHDRQRDRFYATQSVPLLRFTGSEIHRSAANCVDEIGAFLWSRLSPRCRAEFDRRMAEVNK